jgi:hypothetical protein
VTPELERRWKIGAAPFDGSIVASCDEPDLNILHDALSFACAALRDSYPSISVFPDWHEHDGFEVTPKPGDWSAILASLSSARALYDSRDPDHAVRVAIVADSFDWLLRYNIDDEEENDYLTAWCDFDFTCTPQASVAGLVHDLHSKWPGYTDVSAAKLFFDRSYGG